MPSFSRLHKIAVISLGAVGGGLAYYQLNTDKQERKFGVHNSWTTNYCPSVKWDFNWDQIAALSVPPTYYMEPRWRYNKKFLPIYPECPCYMAKLHPISCKLTMDVFDAISLQITDIYSRDPKSVVKPPKGCDCKPEEDNKYNEELEKAKSKSVRHIFLIRHGQYFVDGATDKDRVLTEMGRVQADLTGQRLACLDIKWDLLVRSTMTRAQETATLIAKHLPTDLEVVNCSLIEEGAPIPPEPPVGHWRPEPKFFQDGARIEAGFRRYFHRAPPDQARDSYTLLVCHANVIRYFVCKALQFPPEAWLRISLNHGSITWVSIMPNGNVVLRALGDTGFMEPKHVTSR